MTIKTRSSTKNSASKAAETFDKKNVVKEADAIESSDTKLSGTKRARREEVLAPELDLQAPQLDQSINGRGVFAVRTLGEAVSVEAAFLAEDGNVLRLPAVFPNRDYALQQIEELRQIVNQHFDQLMAK